MIVVVFIFSLLTIITIFSLTNYIFVQGYTAVAETDASSIEEQLKLAQEKTSKGLQTVEYNETVAYNWKTCSDPLVGFSIEYPSHWLDQKGYHEISMEYHEISMEQDIIENQQRTLPENPRYVWLEVNNTSYFLPSTEINSSFIYSGTPGYFRLSSDVNSSLYSDRELPVNYCTFYALPKEYGNSTQQIKEKLEFTQELNGIFDGQRTPQVFGVWTEPAKYESIKVSTRMSALESINSGYDLIEKPNFNKYDINKAETGSYSYSYEDRYKYQNILSLHNNTLYTFNFENTPLDMSEEEYSAVKKHMINSIKWLN